MKRREFLEKSSCAFAGVAATGLAAGSALAEEPQAKRQYVLDIEIFEADDPPCGFKVGEKFKYPQDSGKMCHWLVNSMYPFLITLKEGGTLTWKYEGTKYEKEIDPDGITTEFVRCPDPCSYGVVAKITRKRV
ncbi:hypothetical protein ACFL67_00145 [candidate division KSB1 bacterium]